MPNSVFSIIYTEDGMYLSTRSFGHWRQVQDEFSGYKTSLHDFSADGLIDFLEFDYPAKSGWPDWDAMVRELGAAKAIKTIRVDPEEATSG